MATWKTKPRQHGRPNRGNMEDQIVPTSNDKLRQHRTKYHSTIESNKEWFSKAKRKVLESGKKGSRNQKERFSKAKRKFLQKILAK